MFERAVIAEKLTPPLAISRAPASTNTKVAQRSIPQHSRRQKKQNFACKPVSAVRADQQAEKADTNTLQLIAEITRFSLRQWPVYFLAEGESVLSFVKKKKPVMF
jgi:hypothetical protein